MPSVAVHAVSGQLPALLLTLALHAISFCLLALFVGIMSCRRVMSKGLLLRCKENDQKRFVDDGTNSAR